MSASINVLTAWTDAITELREASAEYLANSRVLSEQCAPAQSRLEQALSQFTDHAQVAPRDYRGMEGRIRELEGDNAELSKEMEALYARLGRVNSLLHATGDFAVGAGCDPVEAEVKDRLAELAPTKRSKRGGA
ncbi:hypothetical protein RHOFW510R12_01385 [Rhodanobacter sp. FW510-R12]|uniref:hypothetical protein n=1 Tax=unclassified Rhodanobacter TaxID=2621553 RepID=UPI0007A9BC95|nr:MULTISPECIES: hypothetical protein [unclassified Rhodanobacter]KZC17043.1 hypothetical protein RHOFW104R8_13460 [Rhodanobacter sp. FW104-R8]KZC28567.1 hypothetical protein RhoFW510T8_10700 [Rhodanobacter sp. FW510-T8]KZC32331.1 hypothetical protein RhoFW510R10_12930 [Rhodanobacter sp. FW510-R10]